MLLYSIQPYTFASLIASAPIQATIHKQHTVGTKTVHYMHTSGEKATAQLKQQVCICMQPYISFWSSHM